MDDFSHRGKTGDKYLHFSLSQFLKLGLTMIQYVSYVERNTKMQQSNGIICKPDCKWQQESTKGQCFPVCISLLSNQLGH